MLANKSAQLRLLLRKQLEQWVLATKFPAFLKIFFIDWALQLDHGVWFGSLWQLPKFWSVWASLVGQKNQVNQLGNPEITPKSNRGFVQKIELQVIAYLKRQLHAPAQVSGYSTTGGTEANLFLLWLARSFFEHKGIEKMVVFGTSFTHYSVTKAARILRMPFLPVAVTPDYVLSPFDLNQQLAFHYQAGVRGFALVVTWGYSSTGGCDDWQQLEPVVRAFHQNHPNTEFFVWIDAAAQGLPLLHISTDHQTPFRSKYIQGYVVDYHKFGGTPIGSGIVLYRKALIGLIQTPIPYLMESDATLLGSRPGSAVLALWASQQVYTADFWNRQFTKQLRFKADWLQKMRRKYPDLQVITHPKTLTLGLVINSGFNRLAAALEGKYALQVISIESLQRQAGGLKRKTLRHYKLHFMTQDLPIL